MVHLVALTSCALRATTEKSQLFLGKKSAPPKKILDTPMNLPTPGEFCGRPCWQGRKLGDTPGALASVRGKLSGKCPDFHVGLQVSQAQKL